MPTFVEQMATSFADELQKIAAAPTKKLGGLGKPLAIAGAGIAGWEALRRAEGDRRNGRMMRIQSNGGGGIF
jgi:hypothetical protein